MTARFAFIPSIAGLRAIAVLLVVLNHYNTVFFTNWLIGDVGVAVFFSISGFLAYYVLQRDELKWGAVSYRYFMLRRILRIWPLYFVIIALTFFTEARLGNVQYPPWSLFTFTFNFDLAAGRHPGLPSLSILWSIAVEEQFYILAPLMYRAMRSRYCALFCVAIFIFANAARLLHLAYVPQPVGGGLYYMTYAYADTFVAGALLAHILANINREAWAFDKKAAWVAFLVAIVLLALIARVWAFGQASVFAFLPYFLIPVAGSLLLWSTMVPGTLLEIFFSSMPMRAIGELSYGIYVCHTYVQNYLYYHVRSGPPMFTEYGVIVYNLGTIACTFLMATVLYFAIERQGLKLKKWYAPEASPDLATRIIS